MAKKWFYISLNWKSYRRKHTKCAHEFPKYVKLKFICINKLENIINKINLPTVSSASKKWNSWGVSLSPIKCFIGLNSPIWIRWKGIKKNSAAVPCFFFWLSRIIRTEPKQNSVKAFFYTKIINFFIFNKNVAIFNTIIKFIQKFLNQIHLFTTIF